MPPLSPAAYKNVAFTLQLRGTMADFLDPDLMPYVSKQFPIQCFVASLFHSSVSAEVDAARAKFVGRIILRILFEAAPMYNRVQPGLHILV